MSALAWLATYLTHSTLACGAVWCIRRRLQDEPALEMLWRTALVMPIASATLIWAGAGPPWRVAWPEWPALAAAVPQAGVLGSWPLDALLTSVSVAIWLLGACGFALDLLQRAIFLRRLARRPVQGAIVDDLRDLQARGGLTRTIRLTSSHVLMSPIAIGRREICLPSRVLDELDPRERRACLAHELAHLRRHDELWGFVLAAVARLLWVQPLNRIACWELRHLAESACDAWAAERLGDPRAVARCLVRIASWPIARAPIGIHGIRGSGRLLGRVQKLLSDQPPAARRSPAILRAVPAAGALFLWCLPGVAPPELSPEYWMGFELGRRYRIEHPVEVAQDSAPAPDLRWRAALERRLQARQALR
jgi:beta-lactamase regulating signal transducer with metallopeptidase domain